MLTDTALKNLRPKARAYKITDRDGMYVYVSTGGAISFRYDYRFNGRRETLTLGRYGHPDASGGGGVGKIVRTHVFEIEQGDAFVRTDVEIWEDPIAVPEQHDASPGFLENRPLP